MMYLQSYGRLWRDRHSAIVFFAVFLLFAGVPVLQSGGTGEQEEPEASDAPARETGSGQSGAISGLRTGEGEIPVSSRQYILGHEPQAFRDNMMSGGPPPDGIPAIDDPEFISPDEADLDPGDRVIGFEYEGVVRAYPHSILVAHEIVNHEIDGQNIAITYCPLTATGQGFKTGSTTLGVSGRLVNSNLVMYDRDTGSLWPQIAGTAIAGERQGESLEEIDLVWTTWERWQERHPDTEVLSTKTGFARNYNRDPYGSYNPTGGYYSSNNTMFPVMHDFEQFHPKHMVIGARTTDNSVMIDLEQLADRGIVETESFLAVYDQALDTGRIYLRDSDRTFSFDNGEVTDNASGERFAPHELPLESVIGVEAFYFAWNAFYPESERS